MVETVLVFAAITAVFEAALLLKFSSEKALNKRWFVYTVHAIAIMVNLSIHWGTIVGTMTAVTAGLVSFGTVPTVRMIFTLQRRWKERSYGHQ